MDKVINNIVPTMHCVAWTHKGCTRSVGRIGTVLEGSGLYWKDRDCTGRIGTVLEGSDCTGRTADSEKLMQRPGLFTDCSN